ncbi:MAG: hypothetical protein HQL23_09545 [Candidatus Omnitrophica bacterium]|nr:hypothetical protein [Candidatus Omnitrophota bacterium]
MKKIILGVLGFVLFSTGVAFAHPPTKIDIKYDQGTKILSAVITHPVKDGQKHFINKVDIGRNGTEIITQSISQQDNLETQTVSYLIPDAIKGDKLSVEGYCNIRGSLKQEITVE